MRKNIFNQLVVFINVQLLLAMVPKQKGLFWKWIILGLELGKLKLDCQN